MFKIKKTIKTIAPVMVLVAGVATWLACGSKEFQEGFKDGWDYGTKLNSDNTIIPSDSIETLDAPEQPLTAHQQ